jgi:hypothetical protein
MYAYSADDIVTAAGYESALFYGAGDPFCPFLFISGAGPLSHSSDAAAAAAAAAPQLFSPSTCMTAQATTNVVSYHFMECSGPLGMTHVSGIATVTFTDLASGLQIATKANHLSVNGSMLDIDSTGKYSEMNNQKKLEITTKSGGTGILGNNTGRTGTYTLQWQKGDTCAMLDASFTDTGPSDGMTDVAGFKLCRAACPAAGTVTRMAAGRSVTLTFAGSSTAAWRDGDGQTGAVTLRCP